MQRRGFLNAGLAVAFSRTSAAESAFVPLDYGRSFLQGKWAANRVRFWVESRTRIVRPGGDVHDYYQCASCKSEDTFARENLFYKDNYDFLPIFGPEDGAIFRRKAWLNPDYRQVRKASEMWEGQTYHLKNPRSARLLSTTRQVREATHEGVPIVAQTEIAGPATGVSAIIEFPVKTMNIHDKRDLYQVDTGPVAFPDLTRPYPRLAESLSLAFVAFNTPARADFVVEDVTSVLEDGRAVARVRHYSRLLSLPARNRLFACD